MPTPFLRFGLLLGLVACSSGAQQVAAPPQVTPPNSGTAYISLTIPDKMPAASDRRLQYISSGTQSMTIDATQGGPVGTLTANCTSVCTGIMSVPLGAVTFAVTLYSLPNAAGSPLSQGSMTQTIVAGPNNLNLTANPVIDHVNLTVFPSTLTSGTPGSATLSVIAKDATNATIVLPGFFVNQSGAAVTLTISRTDSGGPGMTTLTPTMVTLPGQNVMVTYNGGTLATTTFSGIASHGIAGAIIATNQITYSAPTPTPTPTPTPSPTASPTAAPTPTPTATAVLHRSDAR